MKKHLILLVFILLATRLSAQEVQIPFDSAGKVEVITEELERKLQLFPKYTHFHEARLFKKDENAYILEVSSLDDGKLRRDREDKTKADIIAFQKEFAEASKERAPSIFLDQSSRSKFLIYETLLSTFVYSPLLIASFASGNSPNAKLVLGIELVVGGSGYLVPYLLTKNAPVTDGQSSLALGGAFLGLGHGALLDVLFTNGNVGTEIGAITALTSIAETGVGYYIARKNNFSEGTSDVIRYGGLFGALQGAGLYGAIAPYKSSGSASIAAATTLLGSAGGYYAATLLANNHPYTRGSATTLLTAGIAGAYIPSILYYTAIFDVNNPDLSEFELRLMPIIAMGGNIGGVLFAHSLTRDKNYSTAEGNDIVLGTAAGYLIGTGLGYILSSGSASDRVFRWSVTIPSVLGTAAGFYFVVNAIGKGSGDAKNTGWNMNVNPGALFGALIPTSHTTTNAYVPPALSVQYRW